LYFTGSKGFNAAMRGHALKTGVSLNEHGFSKMVAKKKEEKLDVAMKSERDIFDYLGLEYKEPVERVDSRDVVVASDILDRNHLHLLALKMRKGNVTFRSFTPTKRAFEMRKGLGEKENLDTENVPKSPEKRVKFSSSTNIKPKNKTRRCREDSLYIKPSNKSNPDLVEFCKKVVDKS